MIELKILNLKINGLLEKKKFLFHFPSPERRNK